MNLDELIEHAAALSLQELRELEAVVSLLVTASAIAAGEAAAPVAQQGAIEWKVIPDKKRGKVYGPYPYLRYWHNGHFKSQYLKGYQAAPPLEALHRLEQARAVIEQAQLED